jgi:hypothetical protein
VNSELVVRSDLAVPSESQLHLRIASRIEDLESNEVAKVLHAREIELTRPLPAQRDLVVRRLYCDGEKTGTDSNDGGFAFDMSLDRGPWVISSTINSAGKSSLLWALSFALRGEGFDEFCRPETVSWFEYVRADIEASGVAASVRLAFDRPGHPSARLLIGESIEALLALDGREEEGPGVRVVATAEPSDVKSLISRFMMDQLGLQPVSMWVAESNAPKDEDGIRDSTQQVHGWPSFFYAIALNSANDKILLGPTIVGQLPVKLMQLFLDVPFTAEQARLATTLRAHSQDTARIDRRAREDAEARASKIEPLKAALDEARKRLQALKATAPDTTVLVTTVDQRAASLAELQEAHRQAIENHSATRRARQADERAARRARQSSAARMLLGALEPEACPRCDHEIDDARRAAEDSEHQCSVCAHLLPEEAEDEAAQVNALAQIDARLVVSEGAEATCKETLEKAKSALSTARTAHEQAVAKLAQAQSSKWSADFEETQREVYLLEGAVALATGGKSGTIPALAAFIDGEADQADSRETIVDDTTILEKTAEVLREVVDTHSRALFAELNDEIVAIAHDLGVTNLTSVKLTLGGQLNAMKSGKSHKYSAFSPVDRLRMRIAVVVGMIRVGRRQGIMSHPGLLLIDAPTADELAPDVARQVLQTLHDVGNDIPGMQVLITSIEEAVWDIFEPSHIITGSDRRELF